MSESIVGWSLRRQGGWNRPKHEKMQIHTGLFTFFMEKMYNVFYILQDLLPCYAPRNAKVRFLLRCR